MPINPYKTTTKKAGHIKVKAYGLSLTYQLGSSFEADFATHLFSPKKNTKKTKKPSNQLVGGYVEFQTQLNNIKN